MKTFTIERTDHYLIEIEAETKEEALKICDEDDFYLNTGSFTDSSFKVVDEEE